MINRRINWLSSLEEKNSHAIDLLENKLSAFYRNSSSYYSDIDFTSDNWINDNEVAYKDIIEMCAGADKVLEVGCGSANILKHKKIKQSQYFGCDFSVKLITKNKLSYPEANFVVLDKPNILPYPDNSFDVVYSVFVIEHSCYPSKFLDECHRVLRKNGVLIILCPDFLGFGRMSSQRAGFSQGTTTEKLNKKKIIDAIFTYYDNKVKIPLFCKSLLLTSNSQFYINIFPTVFEDTFSPDVDAVYVTNKKEIILYLNAKCRIIPNSPHIMEYEKKRKLIYLKFVKN